MSKWKLPEVRVYGAYDPNEASQESGLACPPEESLTVQEEKDEADINTIVRNFGLTGRVPQTTRIPSYGDFTGVSDYRSAIEAVRDAEANFMQLPPDVRFRFQNDPQQFLEFADNPGNIEELKKMGLGAPAPVAPIIEEPTVSDTPEE